MRTVTALVTLRVIVKINEDSPIGVALSEAEYRIDDTGGGVMDAVVLEVVDVDVEDSR